jgi:hypothetical protein
MHPFAPLDAAPEPGHVRFRARFIEEDESRRIEAGLLSPPGFPRPPEVGPVLFAGAERLFS